MTFLSSRVLKALRSHDGARWACLLVSSIVFAAALEALHLSAALLIGPMIAGVIVASTLGRIRVPDTIFAATQGIIACMIARAMPVSIVDEVAMQWPVFGLGVMSTIVMAAVVGWLLTRWQVLPGTSAIWGSAPGGAASMTLLAEAYGADVRLVAFMQYLRVLCVTSVASLVASLAGQNASAGRDRLVSPGRLVFLRRDAGRGLAGRDLCEGLPHPRRRGALAAYRGHRALEHRRDAYRAAAVVSRDQLCPARLGHRAQIHARKHCPLRPRAAACSCRHPALDRRLCAWSDSSWRRRRGWIP